MKFSFSFTSVERRESLKTTLFTRRPPGFCCSGMTLRISRFTTSVIESLDCFSGAGSEALVNFVVFCVEEGLGAGAAVVCLLLRDFFFSSDEEPESFFCLDDLLDESCFEDLFFLELLEDEALESSDFLDFFFDFLDELSLSEDFDFFDFFDDADCDVPAFDDFASSGSGEIAAHERVRTVIRINIFFSFIVGK